MLRSYFEEANALDTAICGGVQLADGRALAKSANPPVYAYAPSAEEQEDGTIRVLRGLTVNNIAVVVNDAGMADVACDYLRSAACLASMLSTASRFNKCLGSKMSSRALFGNTCNDFAASRTESPLS